MMGKRKRSMPSSSTHQDGNVQHWVTVRPEPTGQYTAQPVGLPDIRTTAATREEALSRLEELLRGVLASGQLVSLEIPAENPLLKWAGRRDPSDPEEQAFLEILAQQRRED